MRQHKKTLRKIVFDKDVYHITMREWHSLPNSGHYDEDVPKSHRRYNNKYPHKGDVVIKKITTDPIERDADGTKTFYNKRMKKETATHMDFLDFKAALKRDSHRNVIIHGRIDDLHRH